MADIPSVLTLNAAIVSEAELGIDDPRAIADRLAEKYTDEWLREALWNERTIIIAERFRSTWATKRNALERSDTAKWEQRLEARSWVPGVGWKLKRDLTVGDLEAQAEFYDQLAETAAARAEWCRSAARAMREERAQTLGDLKVELPPEKEPRPRLNQSAA